MVVRLTVTEQPDGTFAVAAPQAIPTYVDRNDYVVLPVQPPSPTQCWRPASA